MSQFQAQELGRRTSAGPRRSLGGGASLADQSGSGFTFWVDSNHPQRGTNTDRAGTQDAPFSTVAAALASSRLIGTGRFSKDCNILVAEGHAESIIAADGWTMPQDRVSIIGQGKHTQRPLITISTAVTAGITIAKLACMLKNLRFVTTLDAIEDVIEIGNGGAGFMLHDCDFFGGSTLEAETIIKISHAAADDVWIKGCSIRQRTAGGVQAIEITAAVDNLIIEDCWILGDYDNACIHSAVIQTDCRILNNWLANLQTGDHAIQFSTTATGIITGTRGYSTLAAAAGQTAIDQGSCFVGDNLLVDATADKSMIINPVLDS